MVIRSQPLSTEPGILTHFRRDTSEGQTEIYSADSPIALIHAMEDNPNSWMPIKPIVSIDCGKDVITWIPDLEVFDTRDGSNFFIQMRSFTQLVVSKAQLDKQESKEWCQRLLRSCDGLLLDTKTLTDSVNKMGEKFSKFAARISVNEDDTQCPGEGQVPWAEGHHMVIQRQPLSTESRILTHFQRDISEDQTEIFSIDSPIALIHAMEDNPKSWMPIKPIVSIDWGKDVITWTPDLEVFDTKDGSDFSAQMRSFTQLVVSKAQLHKQESKEWCQRLLRASDDPLADTKTLTDIVDKMEEKFAKVAAPYTQPTLAPGRISVNEDGTEYPGKAQLPWSACLVLIPQRRCT